MRRHENRFDFEYVVDETEEGGNVLMHAKGYVTEYRPATMYKKNGDPGDPEEGGEVEIEELELYDDEGNAIEYEMDPVWLDELCTEHASDERE